MYRQIYFPSPLKLSRIKAYDQRILWVPETVAQGRQNRRNDRDAFWSEHANDADDQELCHDNTWQLRKVCH